MPRILTTELFSYKNSVFMGGLSALPVGYFDRDLLTGKPAIYLQSHTSGRILLFVEYDSRIGLIQNERQFWLFNCVENPYSYLSIKLFKE